MKDKLKDILYNLVGYTLLGLLVVFVLWIITYPFIGTESGKRGLKSIQSDWTGGMNRQISVYSYDGKLIKEYTGKIDVESRENSVLFDFKDTEGKRRRVIIYNAIIINEEVK